MNRHNFNQKHQANAHSQQEMERKWRCYLAEQEQFDLIEGRRGLISSPIIASGAGSVQPAQGNLQITVDSSDQASLYWNIRSSELTTFTIDWGDGNVEEFQDDTSFSISHNYTEEGTWNVVITFTDPNLITRLNFND
jgi:hypothetical protein